MGWDERSIASNKGVWLSNPIGKQEVGQNLVSQTARLRRFLHPGDTLGIVQRSKLKEYKEIQAGWVYWSILETAQLVRRLCAEAGGYLLSFRYQAQEGSK